MAHLVSVVSLAADGLGRGTDDSGHGCLDGHSAESALDSAEADLGLVGDSPGALS